MEPVPTIHHHTLPVIRNDFLQSTQPILDWIERNAPDRFQRLILLNDQEQPIALLIVPAARWAAVAADVAIVEAEHAESPGLKAEQIAAGIIERASRSQ